MTLETTAAGSVRLLATWLGFACALSAAAAAPAQAQSSQHVTVGPTPWTLAPGPKLSPDARTVKLSYYVGGCTSRQRVEVQRTATSITVSVIAATQSTTSDGYAIPCPAPLATIETVDLGGRLGQRTILDGSSQQQRYPVSPSAPESVQDAYARLHRRGLPITFDKRIPIDFFGLNTVVVKRVERVGRRGHRALLVHIAKRFAPYPSLAVPIPIPSYTVPDFSGKTVATAAAWADRRNLHWTAGTPPRLVKATASRLLGNYAIDDQTPAAGSRISPIAADGTITELTMKVS